MTMLNCTEPEKAAMPRTREASSVVSSAMRACPVGGIAAVADPKNGPRAATMPIPAAVAPR